MSAPRLYRHSVFEGMDWVPLDLFAYGDGTLPQAGDIDDIDIRVYKAPSSAVVYESLGLSPGNGIGGPIYNVPLLDGSWTQGPPGYNSKHRLAMATLELAGVVIEPGQRYRVEIILNGTPEGRLISVHEYLILGVYSLP